MTIHPLRPVPPAPAAAPAPQDGPSVDPSLLMGALRDRLHVVLTGMVVGLMLAAGWLHGLAEPRYRAMAVLVLDAPDMVGPDLGVALPGLAPVNSFVNTELEVLGARSLLAEVAQALDLAALPEFAPAVPGDGVRGLVLRILPGWAGPAGGPAAAQAAVLDRLRGAIDLRALPDSHIIQVFAESRDPARAAAIANTLVARYQARQVDQHVARTDRAAGWLATRVAELQAELDTAERRARAFEAERSMIDGDIPDVLQADLASLRDRIAARAAAQARADTAAGRAALDRLRQEEAALAARIAQAAQDAVTLAQFQREAAAARMVYETFLADLKETRVQLAAQGPGSTVLSAAQPPVLPARPRPGLVVMLGAVLGAVLAGALVLRHAVLRDGLAGAAMAEAALGLPVLGLVPEQPGRGRVLAHLVRRPNSALSEAVRQVRVGLRLGEPGGPGVLAVTSSVPAEGKTTLSLALACSVAALDRRVLVIEGDIRRRSFARALALPRGGQLSAVIAGDVPLADAVTRERGLGVDLLLAGPARDNAADLLSGPGFAALIRAARAEYDVVVIDTPPVLVVPDARIVARLSDGVVFVARWRQTPLARLRAGLRLLDGAGRGVSGVVISRIDRRRQARAEGGAVDTRGYYRG